jgi:hypothetical protein
MLTAIIFLLITVLGFGAAWMFGVEQFKVVNPPLSIVMTDPPEDDREGKKDTSLELGVLPVEMPSTDQETPHDGAASNVQDDLLQVIRQPDFMDPGRFQPTVGGPQGRTQGTGEKGPGVGKDGVPRERRWIVEWGNESQAEYKRKLDFFHIYLGVAHRSKGVLAATGFSGDLKMTTSPPDLYFQHRDPVRRQVDRDILQAAGVNPSGGIVAQFIPEKTEKLLAKVELEHAKRPEKEIKKTVFGIRSNGDGYEFYVVDQEYR